jgi:hypothetical protein
MTNEQSALDLHRTFYEVLVNYTKPYDRYEVSRRLAMETLYMEASNIEISTERKLEIHKMLIILSELK